MQMNEQGQVALKHTKTGRHLIYGYVFVPQANITMAWVNPIDVEKMFRVKGGCCGGEKRVIFPANEDDVRRWTNRGGR